MFDPTVVLLEPVIEVGIGSMEDISAKCCTDRAWVGVMPVRRYPLWDVAHGHHCLLEELLGAVQVVRLA